MVTNEDGTMICLNWNPRPCKQNSGDLWFVPANMVARVARNYFHLYIIVGSSSSSWFCRVVVGVVVVVVIVYTLSLSLSHHHHHHRHHYCYHHQHRNFHGQHTLSTQIFSVFVIIICWFVSFFLHFLLILTPSFIPTLRKSDCLFI